MEEMMKMALFSMAALSIFFAVVLSIADKKLRVQEDPKIEKLLHLLPGSNCGACGFLGCRDFAEHIVKDNADPVRCRVMSQETLNEVCDVLGRKEEEVFKRFPLVKCSAPRGEKKQKGIYKGVETCNAAQLVFGAGVACEYGCLGYADCVRACPFDALHMIEGLPKVDLVKCVGCGKCVKACPRNIIEMGERKYEKIFYVACSSKDNTLRTRQVCRVGCIACGICEKLSPEKFFVVSDNLSRADYSKQAKQKEIDAIRMKCPTRVIKDI